MGLPSVKKAGPSALLLVDAPRQGAIISCEHALYDVVRDGVAQW